MESSTGVHCQFTTHEICLECFAYWDSKLFPEIKDNVSLCVHHGNGSLREAGKTDLKGRHWKPIQRRRKRGRFAREISQSYTGTFTRHSAKYFPTIRSFTIILRSRYFHPRPHFLEDEIGSESLNRLLRVG